ncbi:hypothetical protein KY285_020503 [Solanum tuberosum]|nr:hypothetical protein KY285_020503 [Solanum tuberosum]
MGELKEMMQNLAEKIGTLVRKVTNLKRLDQVVMELKEQLVTNRESGREKTHMEQDGFSTARHFDERIHPFEGRSHRPRSPTSYNTHHSNFSRCCRGKGNRSCNAIGRRSHPGHLSFMRYIQYLQPTTWNEYVMAMVEIFGTNFDDPMEEIKKIKQVGSVKEYQLVFEINLTRVSLSQENAVSCFIGGLKHELNIVVKITNLTSLSQIYMTARMQEAYLTAMRQPIFKWVQKDSWTKELLYLLEVEELEEWQDSMQEQGGQLQDEQNEQLELGAHVEHMEISMHALNDPDLVKQLRCEVKSIKPEMVAASNGSVQVDKMTSVTWLLQGAEFLWSCVEGPMATNGSDEDKWPPLDIAADKDPEEDPTLLEVLSEFSALFKESAGLPPCRGVFDHRIVLHSGVEPANKRPYRYPSVKKDIIEGLVQQILDQGIIQPSCSTFASPVVLVGEKDGTWDYV